MQKQNTVTHQNCLKHKIVSVKASAGTGKTYNLSARYIALLLCGAKVDNILCLTFTNKSANDMRQKIAGYIANLAHDDDFVSTIQTHIDMPAEKIKARQPQIYSDFLHSFSSIMTIDKFFGNVFRQFAGYLNIDDSYHIANADKEKLGFEFLQTLHKAQLDSLVQLCLKTNKSYASVLELFEKIQDNSQKLNFAKISLADFDIAKDDVIAKATAIKQFVADSPTASALAKKAVEFDSFDAIFSSTWIQKNSFKEFRDFKKIANETAEELFKQFKTASKIYFQLKNHYTIGKLNDIYIAWQKFTEQNIAKSHNLGFSDVTNMTHKLLHGHIDREFLYFRLDSRYDHILLDEFQDTSIVQYSVLKPLIDEIMSQDNERFRSFYFVGDTKQSIYRFRGGEAGLFGHLDTIYNSTAKSLAKNYRTATNIINFVYSVFENISTFDMPKPTSDIDGGFVKVVQTSDITTNIIKKLKAMARIGADMDDIAILAYTNADILKIYDAIKEQLPQLKVSTDTTSMLVNYPKVKAVINLVKYLYYGDKIYKENFHSIIGEKPAVDVSWQINFRTLSVVELVHNIATYYKLFDENMIKFLHDVQMYENITDFVFNIDQLNSHITNQSRAGIVLLTMFKAKGLEFETVFVVDRFKKQPNDTSSLLLQYEQMKLRRIYIKDKPMEYFDDDYKMALEYEKAQKQTDRLNVLYVALTRAKKNLIIFKKPAGSSFDIVPPAKIGRFHKAISPQPKQGHRDKLSFESINYGRQAVSKKSRPSVSSMELINFGLATHYCLEMMSCFDTYSLQTAMKLVRANYSHTIDEQALENIYKICHNLISHKPFIDKIKGYKLSKEQVIAYDQEIKVIDLVATSDDDIVIFDYKTGNQNPKDSSQVSNYKQAMTDITGKTVSGFLLYLSIDGVDMIEV